LGGLDWEGDEVIVHAVTGEKQNHSGLNYLRYFWEGCFTCPMFGPIFKCKPNKVLKAFRFFSFYFYDCVKSHYHHDDYIKFASNNHLLVVATKRKGKRNVLIIINAIFSNFTARLGIVLPCILQKKL
jgi:hypothetical protein